jgi:hypothetical protein
MRCSLDSWQLGMDGKLNRVEFISKILKSVVGSIASTEISASQIPLI